MRLIRTIDRVEREARRELTRNDSAQRVWPTNAVEIDGFEILLRCRTEGLNAGTLVGI